MRDDAALVELDAIQSLAPPFLSPGAPLNSARQMIERRYMVDKNRTLHHQQGVFYRWGGRHYEEVPREVIRAEVYGFLDGALRQEGKNKVAFDPNQTKVAHVLEALAAETQISGNTRAPTWLDTKHQKPAVEFLPVENGLLHLPTRKLLPSTPTFFALHAVDYKYDADAPKPEEWLKFLHTLWSDDNGRLDKEQITTLQEMFGLALSLDTSFQKMFMLLGPPRSGKGTIAKTLTAMVGNENVAGPTLSAFATNFGMAPLIGKPLAIVSDARLSGRADTNIVLERLLSISGEDTQTVDRKYIAPWTGRLPTRLVILSNELPKFIDPSGALASRFIILTMTKSFLGREDLGLANRVLRELPGILNWALDGRDRLAKRGHFVQPRSGVAAAEELADLTSAAGAFVREKCDVGTRFKVERDKLYKAWIDWCREEGRDFTGNQASFGRDLRSAVPQLVADPKFRFRVGGQLKRFYGSVRLKSDSALL